MTLALMSLRSILLDRPSRQARLAVWLLAVALVALSGYLRLHTATAYEFHLLFLLPVALVAWFVSLRRACVIATLAVILWYLAERQLGGDGADRLPLLVNTVLRLGVFLGVAWLLGRLRQAGNAAAPAPVAGEPPPG